MKLKNYVATSVLSMVAFMGSPAFAGDLTTYSVFSSQTKTKIGHLKVEQNGRSIDTDYLVSDNGRGPQTKSHVELDANEVPLSWTITGKSYAGGPVQETFKRTAKLASWTGLAEDGSAKEVERPYVAAAGDPWATGLYTRLAAKAPGAKVDVLPGGTVRAVKRSTLSVGSGASKMDVDLYMIDGLDTDPDFLLLDKQGKLFASLGGYLLIRDGYDAEYERLGKLYDEQVDLVQTEMHAKLAHRMTVPWRITNVRIFDPVKQALGPVSTVSVFDNRIVRIEKGSIDRVPEGEKLVDGNGGTLMAGLVDMHAHEAGWNGLNRLAAGITTIRDMGEDNLRILEKIYERRMHLKDGPRIVRAGFVDGGSDFTAQDGITVNSRQEAVAAVDWYADHDYSLLKIYNSVNPDWVAPMIAEAKKYGMRVAGHIPQGLFADQAIELGYNEVTHLNMLMLQYVLKPGEDIRTGLRLTAMNRFADLDLSSPKVRHTIDLMKKYNVALDTTAAAMERLNIQRDRVTPDGDLLYIDHMPIMFQRNRRRQFLQIPDKKTDAAHFRARDKLIEMTGLLYKEGIRLWPGTDDGVAYTLQHELRLYTKAGIPAAEVLKIDTYDSMKYMGLDHDLGTIERGKLADFILIPGNPIEDITSLRNVSLVVQDGTVYFPSEIYEALNMKPFSAAPVFK